MVEIRVEGLSKKYGKAEVLNDVSFVVGDGEFVVFVGPFRLRKDHPLAVRSRT